MAAGAFGGVAAASSGALPGDSLYGLKRGIEDFKLNYLSDGDDQRGVAYLDQASNRLSEARRLIERDRSGHLDHEQLGEIRRTLAGMTHDASEGHRLLHEAYEQDPNSLGPIQALSAFSRSHREAWGALRDRLPVQLGDVSDQVSSVFDAIDEEVAPLQSLLPQPPSTAPGTGRHRAPGSPSTGGGSSDTRRSTKPSAPDGSAESSHSSTPSESATTGDGLLGGNTGGLLDPRSPPARSRRPRTSRRSPNRTSPCRRCSRACCRAWASTARTRTSSAGSAVHRLRAGGGWSRSSPRP